MSRPAFFFSGPDPRSATERVLEGILHALRPIPSRWLLPAVLAATPGREFDLHRAAAEAVLRRARKAKALTIAARPAGGLGPYRTADSEGPRPWTTVLYGLEPLRAECDCPDYLRGGLGLCKHILAVLGELALGPPTGRPLPEPPLRWDPRVPLRGPADPLARLSFHGPTPRPFEGDFATAPTHRLQLLRDLAAWIDVDRAGPAARRLVVEQLQEANRRAAGERLWARAETHLGALHVALYPFQREGVRRFLTAGRLLLADDMGLGKTIQATAACHLLLASGAASRALVVVPASLKAQWEREWRAACDTPIHRVDGRPAERRAQYEGTPHGVLLVGYAQLRRDAESLRRWSPDVMVLDEAQRIKNWQTQTAQTVKRFTPRWRLVLTGTPLENRIDELASLMDWVDPWALAPKWRLAEAHVTRGVGARGLRTLRQRLEPHLERRRRSEILGQLPPRRERRVVLSLTKRQQHAHDALAPAIAAIAQRMERKETRPGDLKRLITLLNTQRVIANGLAQLEFETTWPDLLQGRAPTPALLKRLESPKLMELRELVRALVVDQGRRLVVFSQWRRMLTLARWALGDVLAPAGKRAVFFTGAESQRKRTRNVVHFHDDPAVAVLLTSDAGSVGLNLQRAASCCVQMEEPWNPAVFEQRVARLHRLGQSERVDVITLATEGSVEARIGTLGADKRALFEGLLDSDADTVDFEAARRTSPVVRLPAGATAQVEALHQQMLKLTRQGR